MTNYCNKEVEFCHNLTPPASFELGIADADADDRCDVKVVVVVVVVIDQMGRVQSSGMSTSDNKYLFKWEQDRF